MLNEGPDIAGDDNLQQATFAFVNVIKELDMRSRANVWEAPAGLSVTDTLFLHKLYHLSTYYSEHPLHD